MRARTLLLSALLALPGFPATSAGAGAIPELVASAGGTLGVEGAAGRAGPSLSLTAQWPIADHFQFGVIGYLDDLGDRTGRLRDPNDGTDLGPVSVLHQSARGASWRVEGQTPSWGRYNGFATASWGVYQVTDDLRGTRIRRASIPGVGVGIGIKRDVGAMSSVGLGVRYTQLWRGAVQHYLAAGLEWRWHRAIAG